LQDRAAEEIDNLSNFKEDVVDKIKTKFGSQGFDSTAQDQASPSEQI
jgi:hypothetical protein